MSSLRQDHSHQTTAASDSSSSIPTLPAYAYTQPLAKRSKIAAASEQNASNVFTNGDSRSDSPDPHEFYRRHQDQYRASLEGPSGQGDIRVERRGGTMAAAGKRSTPLTSRNLAPTSRINNRYNESPTSERSPLSTAKSSPSLANTARNRQTSLKDLVNKFNQTPDEALPLPRKSSSRSPSTHSNHVGSGSNVRVQHRTASLPKDSANGLGQQNSSSSLQSIGIPKTHPRKDRNHEDPNLSPRSRRQVNSVRTDPVNSRRYASHSTTNLGQHEDHSSQKPLFGEVLAFGSTHADPGYGIPKAARRRGSEGSMHSPNPMFPREHDRYMPEISPSSPSAWYLGVTPTLEEIKTEKAIPDLPTNIHRRTRSDFSGAPSKPPTSRMYGIDLSPSRDPPSSSSSTTTSKRNSHSRIPISTARRQSFASDSGNSSQSTRPSSALGRTHLKSPTRSAIPFPKLTPKPKSPPQCSRSSTPQRSPRGSKFHSGTGHPTTSPLLTAYISSPMPKKSPPLRSSRPRQTVSSASTSASRARAVERFANHENTNMKASREVRPRKPPELAGVDFAARREKIQQAVTKTVKEEERKDEQRRASMALSMTSDGHALEVLPTANENEITSSQFGSPEGEENLDLQNAQRIGDDLRAIDGGAKTIKGELAINSSYNSEKSGLDLNMEDSPTLGTFNHFSVNPGRNQGGGESTPSDVEPSSAITIETSDSVDTFFDDEPQDDSQSNSRQPSYSHEHQTLLSQIMTMRDAGSSPENVRRRSAIEESPSELDDRESIQIMLGETPVTEREPFHGQDRESHQEPQSCESVESRWSMSSWTSSIRSRDDREAPMERIDEHSPTLPTQPEHLSISTSTTQETTQPWSPQSYSSSWTVRTTMDSDAYSTINRVLDQYHDTSAVSPEMMHDAQQHFFAQSPDLARQGGWDPKKVTQLYLQGLAKGKYGQSASVLDSAKSQNLGQDSSMDISEVPEKEVRDDHREKMVNSIECWDDESTPPGTSLCIDRGSSKHASASLTGPDDWDMSPSLGGLQMQADFLDSPVEDRPNIPSNDGVAIENGRAEMPDRTEAQSEQTIDSRPQLPPIKGLGLEIKIMPPQMNDSPILPPPLPFHQPPPPPAEQSSLPQVRSPPSPSIYGDSTIYSPSKSTIANQSIPPLPNPESNESSHQSTAPSVPPSGSSTPSISQDRPLGSIDAISKTASPTPDQKRLTRRRHIIKELVDTEHSFGQDMKVVDDIYRGTANVIVISADDIKTLFGNSDQIVMFSTTFLDALKHGSRSVYTLAKSKRWRSNRISSATSYSGNTDDQSSVNDVELSDDEKDRKTSIGEAFGRHMANMEKVYTDYLKNHDAANQKLQALLKNQKVQIWLKECRAYAHDLTSAWDLDSLLVKPVQRILKYPLLLDQLLEVTPENHPDFTALDIAAREMKGMAKRIDEMKKRADLMEQVTSTRKRKESDVRVGLSKAFGRRTEKLRQQVGLTDVVEDRAYSAVSEKFGSHFFQLQVVMRDVEMYTNDVQIFVNRFCDFALAMEAHVDVGQTSHPELESKWRKFRMSTREILMTALTDHVNAVRKNVIEPMTTLLKLHDGPQKLMQKRDKRIADFARFKAVKDRGDKPDKKTIEQGEQFQAVNDTLKEELPRLFALTGKLVEACLNNFVQLQLQWQRVWRKKLSQAIDDNKIPTKAQEIVEAFTADFAFVEAQVLALGVCNGSMLNEVANQINFLSPTTTLNGEASHSSSLELSKSRTLSISSDKSPVIPHPDFGARSSGSFFPVGDGVQLAPAANCVTGARIRASSTLSGHSPRTPEVPGSYYSYSNNTTPVNATPNRPLTATPRTYTEPSPAMSRPSVETPSFSRQSEESTRAGRSSATTYPSSAGSSQPRDASDSQRYSGFFSSAMPMSDSPPSQSPAPGQGSKDYNVIFLAASVYEFNIDRARKEAGYPYLTYVAGEIFDVIGEKGELWLAKNQDDAENLVGWIWNKHFVKLAS